jgi:hypothetical protein
MVNRWKINIKSVVIFHRCFEMRTDKFKAISEKATVFSDFLEMNF